MEIIDNFNIDAIIDHLDFTSSKFVPFMSHMSEDKLSHVKHVIS